MNTLLQTIKEANQSVIKGSLRRWYQGIGGMIILGIILLVIDTDQFITIAVLLIWFAMIILIITLFRSALLASKNRRVYIQNSVQIAYQTYISEYNEQHQTDYQIIIKENRNTPWFLLPSFATIDINFIIQDEFIRMTHAEAYTKAGSNQKRTHYFKGLYISMDGFSGQMQYRDKGSLSDTIIHTLQPIYGEDKHDISNYTHQEPYQNGTFYSVSNRNIPPLFEDVLTMIHKQEYTASVKLGIQNNTLQIAIEETKTRLPYVKKYTESELENIRVVVHENCSLLQAIQERLEDEVKVNEEIDI